MLVITSAAKPRKPTPFGPNTIVPHRNHLGEEKTNFSGKNSSRPASSQRRPRLGGCRAFLRRVAARRGRLRSSLRILPVPPRRLARPSGHPEGKAAAPRGTCRFAIQSRGYPQLVPLASGTPAGAGVPKTCRHAANGRTRVKCPVINARDAGTLPEPDCPRNRKPASPCAHPVRVFTLLWKPEEKPGNKK